MLRRYPSCTTLRDSEETISFTRSGSQFLNVKLLRCIIKTSEQMETCGHPPELCGLPKEWDMQRKYKLSAERDFDQSDQTHVMVLAMKAWTERLGIFDDSVLELEVDMEVSLRRWLQVDHGRSWNSAAKLERMQLCLHDVGVDDMEVLLGKMQGKVDHLVLRLETCEQGFPNLDVF